jgi:hypothetical protein
MVDFPLPYFIPLLIEGCCWKIRATTPDHWFRHETRHVGDDFGGSTILLKIAIFWKLTVGEKTFGDAEKTIKKKLLYITITRMIYLPFAVDQGGWTDP